MSISENIKTLCKLNGTSMYKLEKELGIGNGTIGKWGKNGRVPNYDTLSAVASALGVTVAELTGDDNATPLSSIGANIVAAAGNINAARLTLRSLYIDDAGINAMLYGGYVWTDNALAQIAEALGCSVDALKKETAPTVTDERDLEMLSLLSRLTPEQKQMLLLQIKGLLPPQE